MPGGEAGLTHVPQFQPVLGHFFELFVNQWFGSLGAVVALNDAERTNVYGGLKRQKIHNGLFGYGRGLPFQRVINRQPFFRGKVYARSPTMSSAMVDVVLDGFAEKIIRHDGIAAGKRNRPASGKPDQTLAFGNQQVVLVTLN